MKHLIALLVLLNIASVARTDEAGVTVPNNGNPISVKSDGQGGFIATQPDGESVRFVSDGSGFRVTDINGNPIANIQPNGAGGFELTDKDGHVYQTEKAEDSGYEVKDASGNPVTKVSPADGAPAVDPPKKTPAKGTVKSPASFFDK